MAYNAKIRKQLSEIFDKEMRNYLALNLEKGNIVDDMTYDGAIDIKTEEQCKTMEKVDYLLEEINDRVKDINEVVKYLGYVYEIERGFIDIKDIRLEKLSDFEKDIPKSNFGEDFEEKIPF